jgi:hypothetical protein
MNPEIMKVIRREKAPIETCRELPAFEELASIFLTLANSGGGSLVIGVGEDGHVTGVRDLGGVLDRIEDVQRLIRPTLRIERTGKEREWLVAEVLPERRVCYVLDEENATSRTFRQDGQFWTIGYDGITKRVKDSRGMHYIHYLLGHPHKDFAATELALAFGGRPASGATPNMFDDAEPETEVAGEASYPYLDDQARREYADKLNDLRQERLEAETYNDLGRKARLDEQVESIEEHIKRATGLGSRDRQFASREEADRKSVSAAIHRALREIEKHHPACYGHLALHLQIGPICRYEPRRGTTWST